MDIGARKDDYTFYEGYEGEGEIIISLPDKSYHFWDGFFEDIFGNPTLTDENWMGFTRDYNEYINAFAEDCIEIAIIPDEYLKDMMRYVGRPFSYKETEEVLECLISIMQEAEAQQICVLAKVN